MVICEEHRFSLSEFDNAFLSLCSESQINQILSVCFLFQESRYYYKIVSCSKVPEIEEELNKLLFGKLTKFCPTPTKPIRKMYMKSNYDRSKTIIRKTTKNYHPRVDDLKSSNNLQKKEGEAIN